ncbi:hypothetical protein BD289DRAFT_84446 [Coniella lustricola]|uniref:Uncharacterized protein n=1 Tax=Coniella lustricola TaxID=2025994 RepID=A0A2T3AHF3_9PEZI|nr:hypothetical protein BD289DRAFT_84446 [Coniella lustricola]
MVSFVHKASMLGIVTVGSSTILATISETIQVHQSRSCSWSGLAFWVWEKQEVGDLTFHRAPSRLTLYLEPGAVHLEKVFGYLCLKKAEPNLLTSFIQLAGFYYHGESLTPTSKSVSPRLELRTSGWRIT